MNSDRSWRLSFEAFSPRENLLTVLSLGLGILSIAFYGFAFFTVGMLQENLRSKNLLFVYCALGGMTAVAAVIFGHIGRQRSKRPLEKPDDPGGGRGGLITGYLGIALAILLTPALSKAVDRSQRTWCANFLVQINGAIRRIQMDAETNGTVLSALFYPTTNTSSAHESPSIDADGFDSNSWLRFRAFSNWLPTPFILACPSDRARTPASSWETLGPSNVTYRIHVTTNALDRYTQMELLLCPIHGTVALADGIVEGRSRYMRK